MMTIEQAKLIKRSIEDFYNHYYAKRIKPILFWDTCALLDILRFFIHTKGGNVDDYIAIEKIFQKIEADEIYSVSSNICMQELTDNYPTAYADMEKDLEETENDGNKLIEIVNCFTCPTISPLNFVSIGLKEKLEMMFKRVIYKTTFINENKDVALAALNRVTQKRPPAKAKQEFKDCAIWETMMSLCFELNKKSSSEETKKVFYTTNIKDFCEKDGKINGVLETDASTRKYICCCNIVDVLKEFET